MAAKGKFGKASDKASEAAKAAQSNQYLQRLIEDEGLHAKTPRKRPPADAPAGQ